MGSVLKGDGGYAARANMALNVYNAELEPPATNYADVKSGLTSGLKEVHAVNSNRTAAFVSRIPRMLGLVFNWSWGATDQGKHAEASLPQAGGSGLNGFVNSTMFQRILVQLHDWQTNRRWYISYPMGGAVFMGSKAVRYTYPSFRTQQISANTSGGVGPARMTPRNKYTAVQKVPRYNATPRFYSTTSAMRGGNRGNGYSTLNGPGV